VEVTVIKGKDLEKEGMNLMYAVGKGSVSEPYMVSLSYKGDETNPNNTIALVGKGVCFDTGGLSLKTSLMEKMYGDKGGAISCLEIFHAAVHFKLKINLVCTMGYVENSVDGNSYRNSDIIKSYKGLTVEILNTDAEGRLVLADCLSWTQFKHKPQFIIDIATLTGGCIMALGFSHMGIMGNDEKFIKTITEKSAKLHEPFWPLPLESWHKENTSGLVADLQNMGKQAFGLASTAAAFLSSFIEKDVKWAHLDIAAAILTGHGVYGVREIYELLRDWKW